jgi:DNA-binding beta-propeller fold protein YncE
MRLVPVVSAILFACLALSSPAVAEDPPAFVLSFGGPWDGELVSPAGVAVDGEGNVFVADSNNHRIQKFTSQGVLLGKWGALGSGDGQFRFPRGVAVDEYGNVLVADTSNSRIQKFTSEGMFLEKWGVSGSGDGQFFSPSGVAVDAGGNVLVADSSNHRIQKFTSAGGFILKWGASGSGDGQFSFPQGIAVDADGDVFVADAGNNRIQKFTSVGGLILKWGASGSGNGQFSSPQGVAVDADGNVFVADAGNNRIQKFTDLGGFVLKSGTLGNADGQLSFPRGVAVDAGGNVFVADSNNNRIQKFLSDGEFLRKWGAFGGEDGQLLNPRGVAVGPGGSVFVADFNNNTIQRFGSEGAFLGKWGSFGTADGQFWFPAGVAVDADGNVFVVDNQNARIQAFTSEGEFLRKWGTFGSADKLLRIPHGVAVNADGEVFVADTGNHRIQKFTSTGLFLGKWGSSGSGDGQFSSPFGVAVDAEGNVFVADSGNNRIQKFTSAGGFILKWGILGLGDGQFRFPNGVAVDEGGNVLVADVENDRIQKFTSEGVFLAKWGALGSGDGEFFAPYGVAVDAGGNVFVTDSANHRVQRFTSDFDGDGSPPSLDCNNDDPHVHPDSAEVCDGIDNDCDGLVDDADSGLQGAPVWYGDADGDGFGDPANSMAACVQPTGFLADASDCSDADPNNWSSCATCADADGDTWYTGCDRFGTIDGPDCDDSTSSVHPRAGELCDGVDNDCNGIADETAALVVHADRHTVGSGSRPGSTKEPLVALEIGVYDKSLNSCARTLCEGVSWQEYGCIASSCEPVTVDASTGETARALTGSDGEVDFGVPPGDYLVIGDDGTNKHLGVSASDLVCGETTRKYLQQLVTAEGQTHPGKTTRRTGSELLIIEPEYVEWTSTEQLYPIVLESVGDWNVTTSVAPPEGFVSDHDSLSATVVDDIASVQFTITDVGSEWIPTEVEHVIHHRGRREIVLSRVGVLVAPDLARQKGLDEYGKPLDAAGRPIVPPGFDPRSQRSAEIAGWVAPSSTEQAWLVKLRANEGGAVVLSLRRGAGVAVRSLFAGVLDEGEHEIRWDGLDDKGKPVRPGEYFFVLTAGESSQRVRVR